MAGLLVNIDVPDLAAGLSFYTAALGLTAGRRLGPGAIELLGAPVPIYLLAEPAGSPADPAGHGQRRYDRHWSPIHLDHIVDDIDAACARAVAAGAVIEGETRAAPYGRLARLADPFGHGFCLIQFTGDGYDALAT